MHFYYLNLNKKPTNSSYKNLGQEGNFPVKVSNQTLDFYWWI